MERARSLSKDSKERFRKSEIVSAFFEKSLSILPEINTIVKRFDFDFPRIAIFIYPSTCRLLQASRIIHEGGRNKLEYRQKSQEEEEEAVRLDRVLKFEILPGENRGRPRLRKSLPRPVSRRESRKAVLNAGIRATRFSRKEHAVRSLSRAHFK